jgi:homoserine kinase type II
MPIPKPRRGLRDRPTLPPHLDLEIADRYGGLVSTGPMVEIGGSSTLNLRLHTTDGVFVVRLYRSWMPPARLQSIQAGRHHLADVAIPCPLPVAARDGNSWTEVDGHLVEIEPCISFDGKMDTWDWLEQGLPLLGRLHDRLLSLDAPREGHIAPASNSIDREDLVEGVRQGAARLRDVHMSDDELELADASEMLAQQVATADRSLDTGPRQLVHGDFWDNNVSFRDGQIVLVADLEEWQRNLR